MATTEVSVRGASMELRTVKISKSLLKQLRVLRHVPPEFCQEGENSSLLRLDRVVGWIHGSVLGDEFTRYVLFRTPEGDAYLYNWPGFYQDGVKQIYI